MINNNVLKQQYFDWLCSIISPDEYFDWVRNYSQLLLTLHSFNYVPHKQMDQNRLIDGLNLRNIFAEENGTDEEYAKSRIDERCSVFEMMVALAYRCESDIMSNPDIGNRTNLWFRYMLESLNLLDQINEAFNQYEVERRINIFLNEKYDANGRGGLFTVNDTEIDMRTKDLWYQMQAFLCEYDLRENCKKIVITSLR